MEQNSWLRADDDEGREQTFDFKVTERDATGSVTFERRWGGKRCSG